MHILLNNFLIKTIVTLSYIYISPYVCNGILRHWISFEYPWLFHSPLLPPSLENGIKNLNNLQSPGCVLPFLCDWYICRSTWCANLPLFHYLKYCSAEEDNFLMIFFYVRLIHFRRFQILKVRKQKTDKNCYDWYFSFLNFSEQ